MLMLMSKCEPALRPGANSAPLMCRTKLKVRLRSDFGATVDSDGVLASNLIQEASGMTGKQFSMRKYMF